MVKMILRLLIFSAILLVIESHSFSTPSDIEFWSTPIPIPECWWTKWTNWTPCTNHTCSPLKVRTRRRRCVPEVCSDCWPRRKVDKQKEQCKVPCCEGYPKWGVWGSWGLSCSEYCVRGQYVLRYRACLTCQQPNGTGGWQKLDCRNLKGGIRQKRLISDHWGKWSAWSECSATCGRSVKSRSRSCIKDNICPPPLFKQPRDQVQTRRCKRPCCSVPASWTNWSQWSKCSVSCGNGHQVKTRKCQKARCSHQTVCEGKAIRKRNCTAKYQVNKDPATWSDWSPWSRCSVTCGVGHQERGRRCLTCSDQSVCQGKNVHRKKCTAKCETCEEPLLQKWGPWGECVLSDACSGLAYRQRTCIQYACQNRCTFAHTTQSKKCRIKCNDKEEK